ncbi:MAG: alpha/beta fold hydrolase [Burkholderiales bacterium]
MFEGFQPFEQRANGITIRGIRSPHDAAKPALLLLHGYPQTHIIWHRVAPALAERFNVVATDLRGYGASDKPHGGAGHAAYSKREMARDQLEVMEALGYGRFFVCGHDRGARVAHRMAMDHPYAVLRLMTLDISPTLAMYEQTSMAFARAYWWWFFLIQPEPFPENMILADPRTYLHKKIGYGRAGLTPFAPEAYAAYLANVSNPDCVHAMCEDYRAAASIDLTHDRTDRDAGRMVTCPMRVLWAEHGVIHRCFKPLEDWRRVAADVSGRPVPSGHYIPEEIPDVLLAEMLAFFVEEGTA